jgi:uncharacterized protein
LFTFPVLLAFGYAPVVANVSNTVGLVPGYASGAWGFRRELAGQRRRAIPLACASLSGGVYGGYFGAAQGILVLAVLGLSIDDRLHRLNALKAVLVGLVNLVSGIVFVFAAHIAWAPAGLIAGGSILGGLIGARRRPAVAGPGAARADRRRRGRRDHPPARLGVGPEEVVQLGEPSDGTVSR